MPLSPLRPSDYVQMPWKNGLGTTAEILRRPQAGSEAFQWRISIATLTGSGPFSAFPGIERFILQLDGAPMRLLHKGHGTVTLKRFQPHWFRGDWETHGELEPGPARDFNVMTDPRHVRAEVQVAQLQASGTRGVSWAEGELLIHCVQGRVELLDHSLAAGDSLHAVADPNASTNALLRPSSPDALVVLVSLRAVSQP